MKQFKVGDKVIPVNVARYTHRNFDQVKALFGDTLVVRSVHYDGPNPAVFAGVPGDGCWEWHPDDLRLVSETQTEPPEPATVETTIQQFKAGNYVVPVRADRDQYSPEMKELVGNVLQIHYGFSGQHAIFFLQAGKLEPKSRKWFWHGDDLRLATSKEVTATPKPAPLRRGDLVEYDGDICMVFDEHTSIYGERLIVVLDSKDRRDSVYAYIDELTRVGSIRKKIKRIKKEMEDSK